MFVYASAPKCFKRSSICSLARFFCEILLSLQSVKVLINISKSQNYE